LDDRIRRALARGGTIDITTVGRKTKKPRRIEIWFHNVGGRVYLSGLPGRRSWYANLLANPDFMFHLKGSLRADLHARARPVTEDAERRGVLSKLLAQQGAARDLDAWMRGSPLVEITFEE
jgi:deazaflavin-dependent oxidoreductase (nitroreductase family)